MSPKNLEAWADLDRQNQAHIAKLEAENARLTNLVEIAEDRIRNLKLEAEALSRKGSVKVREDDLVATCKAAVDSDGEPLQMSFKGWPKDKGYRFLARAVLSSLEPAAPAEPDFASTIAAVIKDECDSGAAAGWRSCTGCHETNEGYETGRYPYSTMFGCHVGHGCSECGGLGVVWEYWSGSALEAMARDDEPAAPEGQQEVVDWKRVDDALVSCAGLLKTLCRDEIGDTAAAELEYVRSVVARPAEQAVTGLLPQDVIDLVIAARIVAFEDQSPEALRALDLASEAFASRVPWDEDPEALKAAMEAGRHD